MVWNVRGINCLSKQSEVKKIIANRSLGLISLIETKVKDKNMGRLYSNMFSGWCFTSNSFYHQGGRIVLAWNPLSFQVQIEWMNAQLVHCWISPQGNSSGFYCTIIYAFNSAMERESLWKELRLVKVENKPWIVAGDFNCVLSRDERISSLVRESEIAPFRCCLNQCQLEDIKSSGCFYTWNNKQEGQDRVYSKLDRVLDNVKWMEEFQNSEAHFLPEGIFDHSPMLIKVYNQIGCGKKPFKYFHMWSTADDFGMRVSEAWSTQITGCAMYRVVKKMKLVKDSLKQLNRDGKLAERHQSFLKQKARLDWMRGGDENTREQVNDAFQQYYIKLLGTERTSRVRIQEAVIQGGPVVTEEQGRALMRRVSPEEIKDALFSIPGDKSPGPDGYGSYFFKDAWDIIGNDCIEAVLDFFNSKKLLKQLNHTILALIPKVKCPKSVTEFRPITCCNVLYKCMTKLLCNRLNMILPDIIAPNQGAFIQGRFIAHNILICQDIVRQYGRKSAKPSCIIKMDLKKAYDSIDWNFLEDVMGALRIPVDFIRLIMECVKTPSYSLMINGSLVGYFKGKKGLRQGDPISPLLFVICMEYFSRTM
ncbi:uncharacterized protein LOC125498834 [Beta vulgaris subsp. vulgaris]|uniref:uncharacterized protein LOC125498834 n=1 Tax=Beta vulgaris subsp. vulgaris TaxID=3555 RepID=UPI002036ECE4|nr:uncharacterized protein LOC125498834 [Beta vulgaris subsp. vulgaris]